MGQDMHTWADVQEELQKVAMPLSDKISQVASNIVGIHPSILMDSVLDPSSHMTVAWFCVRVMLDTTKVSKMFQCISSELTICTSLDLSLNQSFPIWILWRTSPRCQM